MIRAWQLGDLVKIVEDPMSFIVGDDVIGLTGVITKIDQDKQIYTVLMSGGTRYVKVLDFMMERLDDKKSRKSNKGRMI